MKRYFVLWLCSLALVGRAEDKGLPTVFVKPLDGDMAQIQGWQPALGEGLAEMLITELTKLNKFQVLESTALKDLKGEIDLGDAGYVAEDEKVQKGGWKGADFMFVGKVTRFGANKRGVDLGGFVPGSLGALGVKQSRNDVQINWRLVDAATRAVVGSSSATGTHNGVGFDIGVAVSGHGGNIGYQNQDFMNSALGKATVKAISNIMTQVSGLSLPASGRQKQQAATAQKQQAAADQAQQAVKQQAEAAQKTPGKILAVPAKGTVIVSLGSNQGLKAGDKVNVYETVDTKDEKGEVVFTEEKLVGEITLDSVQADRSKANYTGSVELKNGWVVKKP